MRVGAEVGPTPIVGSDQARRRGRQLDMFAERASAASMRPIRRRRWPASMANVLLWAMCRLGLALLKIGALVRISVRRAKVAMAPAHPRWPEFALGHARCGAA